MKNTGETYNLLGLVIVTVLMAVGGALMWFYMSAIPFTFAAILQLIFSVPMIFSLFFVGVGVYCWYLFIINMWSKPKESVLLLKYIEKNRFGSKLEFINAKGKVFYFTLQSSLFDAHDDVERFKENQFYTVLKTKNMVHMVMDVSIETFEEKEEKQSYWLNCYTPFGSFENLFLLPVFYVMLLIGLSFFVSGIVNPYSAIFNIIIGLIIDVIPGFIIIYDLFSKIKMKKTK